MRHVKGQYMQSANAYINHVFAVYYTLHMLVCFKEHTDIYKCFVSPIDTDIVSMVELQEARGHDDVIQWKRFLRYWPFVHKGQWRGALMCFYLRLKKTQEVSDKPRNILPWCHCYISSAPCTATHLSIGYPCIWETGTRSSNGSSDCPLLSHLKVTN